MSELAKRVAVATVAIPVVLALVYAGGWFVGVPLAAFAGWAAHEVYRLSEKKAVRAVEWVGVPAAAALVLLATAKPDFGDFAPPALAMLVVVVLLSMLEAVRARGPDGQPMAAVSVTLFGTVYVGLSLSFAPLLRALPEAAAWDVGEGGSMAGLLIVLLPLVATWVGDASAFFAGRAWGKRKLAPTISPNKSWVGFWADLAGGGVAASLWLIFAGPYLPEVARMGPLVIGLLGAVLGLAAVIGDLLESLLKREAGVKDSGTFFPGHGGVLDRVDSLIFTIPGAYVLLIIMAAFT